MSRLALVAVLLAAAQTARADKDPDVASALSGAGAGVSSAIILSSFLVTDHANEVNMPLLYTGLGTSMITPSLGEFYAGQYLTIGMGVRAAAAGLVIYGVTTQTETVTCTDPGPAGRTCQKLTGNGIAVLGIAAIAYIGGAWYDVADAPDAVVRRNKRTFQVVPTVVPSASGTPMPGLYFSATY